MKTPAQSLAALLLAMFVGPLAAPPAAAQDAASPTAAPAAVPSATARITYMTSASAYVDAGRDDGLREGDELAVLREGQTVGALKVTYLSAHRASCTVLHAAATLAVGDLVRYTPRGVPAPSVTGSAAAETGSAPRARSRGFLGGMHGRVGVRYLSVQDRTGGGHGFSEPAFDLRADGYGLGGSPIDVSVDLRARRAYRTTAAGASENDSQNRLYRLAVSWHVGEPGRTLTVGRQFAPALAVLSIFDGVLYNRDWERWSAGGFTGVQPDPVDLSVSSDIQEYGGYVQYRSAPDTARVWNLTTGIIGSYTDQGVNREFLYLQTQYHGSRLSSYVSQEVDYNRAWKVAEAGESTISPTSTFANLHLRASEHLDFYAGYDNRRNVRLYRDRVTPATEFDDSHRQGGWAGASLRLGEHVLAGADLRTFSGGPSGSAHGYSANLGVDRLTRASLGLSGRGTRYGNDLSEGSLYSVSLGMNLGARVHLEITEGTLQETSALDSTLDRNADWTDLNLDILLGRRWYLLLSGERNDGNMESNDQIYTSLSYRF